MSDQPTLSRRAFIGAAGVTAGVAAVAPEAQSVAAQENGTEQEGTPGGNETGGATPDGTQTGGGNGTDGGNGTAAEGSPTGGGTVTVQMTDELLFEPESASVAPGGTVVWENTGSVGHSVTGYEEEIPEEADYFASGGFDSEQAARDAYAEGDPESGDVAEGETFEHTFDTEGTYGYFCIPHESAGMVGTVEVTPGGGGGGNATGPEFPEVPESAKLFTLVLSVFAIGVLGMGYFVMKYGGDYEMDEE